MKICHDVPTRFSLITFTREVCQEVRLDAPPAAAGGQQQLERDRALLGKLLEAVDATERIGKVVDDLAKLRVRGGRVYVALRDSGNRVVVVAIRTRSRLDPVLEFARRAGHMPRVLSNGVFLLDVALQLSDPDVIAGLRNYAIYVRLNREAPAGESPSGFLGSNRQLREVLRDIEEQGRPASAPAQRP